MSEPKETRPDPRSDAERDAPADEAGTGSTPQTLYAPLAERDHLTLAPDGRPMEEQPAWRTDFPIDWPQHHYVTRRDFAKFMVLTSSAFATGHVWIAGQSIWRRASGAPPPMRIASLDDIAIGSTLTFSYPTPHDPCILVRLSADRLIAYGQKCTHLACAVVPRPAEGVIHCPCHEGYFDLETGRPIAGPPPRPLPSILLDVRGAEVYATGVAWRTS